MVPASPARQNRLLLVGGCALLAVVLTLSAWLPADPGEALTRNTVRLSLAWYAAALCLMLRLRGADDWSARTPLGQLARGCWTWGLVVFLVHLAMAFHFFHHWSHSHAFQRTREVSGVGEGIYVSYLFTWLWIADVLVWLLRPAAYAARPAWSLKALHAFMLVIVFNGMVVFETGFIRWAGLAMFMMLTVAWLASRRKPGASAA